MPSTALLKQSRLLPNAPGVYLFRDAAGGVLYVGKATSLQHRVRSYFAPRGLSPKTQRLVDRTADIDFILTASEQEAFLLENSLIKRHQPHFNIRLKDDKSYPFLKITLSEEWPRVHITRHVTEDGSRYFGPFASVRSLRRTMNLVSKLFGYRTCKMPITEKQSRPCLKYHIHRCAGPCLGVISQEEYGQIIAQVILFLEGNYDRVIRVLKKKMMTAASKMEFENAASIRDQIQAIESIMEQQTVVSARRIDADAIAIAQQENQACAEVFFIRKGKIMGKESFDLEGVQDESAEQVLASFIKQLYGSGNHIPPTILLQAMPPEASSIEAWLQSRQERKVRLMTPQRGERKKLLELAARNAAESLEQRKLKWLTDTGKTAAALDEAKAQLQLPRLPHRIECYDISNIRGTAAVGSMVVFEDGQPKPPRYRRFKIKSVAGIDDYAMMQEVLWRRFGKGRKAPPGAGWELVPDLILIDGGKGHLNAARDVLKSIGLESIPVAAIAKENEDIFLPQLSKPINLPSNSEGLYLLQRVRDEAHRFAISYHIKTRRKAGLKSSLDEIPGIGPRRKSALLKRFGSLKGIRQASEGEIASVSGMTPSLAETVKKCLS